MVKKKKMQIKKITFLNVLICWAAEGKDGQQLYVKFKEAGFVFIHF